MTPHLDELLVQLSDRLQLLVLHHAGLLQDLLLLPEQILQREHTESQSVTPEEVQSEEEEEEEEEVDPR